MCPRRVSTYRDYGSRHSAKGSPERTRLSARPARLPFRGSETNGYFHTQAFLPLFWIFGELGIFFTFFKVQLYAPTFRNRKVVRYIFVWLTLDYFRWKREIFFKVQLCTPSFRNRKRGKRFSRLKRRRESVASSPHIILSSVNLFPRLRSLLSSLADAPHCSIWGSVRS